MRLEILIWLGSYYEHSILGIEIIYSDKETPRPGIEVIIKDKKDLKNFEDIDFIKAGQVPIADKFFESTSNYLEGTGIKTTMSYFNRGPFGILATLMVLIICL